MAKSPWQSQHKERTAYPVVLYVFISHKKHKHPQQLLGRERVAVFSINDAESSVASVFRHFRRGMRRVDGDTDGNMLRTQLQRAAWSNYANYKKARIER